MKFNEDSRVKIPSILHLMRLGYGYLSLKDPKVTWDESTNIFTDILHNSIQRINEGLSELEIYQLYADVSLCLEVRIGVDKAMTMTMMMMAMTIGLICVQVALQMKLFSKVDVTLTNRMRIQMALPMETMSVHSLHLVPLLSRVQMAVQDNN